MNKAYQLLVSFFGGIVSAYLGAFDIYLKILVVLMTVDLITGVIKGWENENLDSREMTRGIIKKVFILVMVGVGFQLDLIINGDPVFRNMIIIFYIANEGLSIIENVGEYVEYPKFLKDKLEQLKNENDKAD